jgi:hypothetical protein
VKRHVTRLVGIALCGLALFYSLRSAAQSTAEVLLSTENAFNAIPSPDGRLIAYVRTGWGREGGSSGFGRSNLRSEVVVMTSTGENVSRSPVANAFLFGWTTDSHDLICYRDWHFFLVGPNGAVSRQAEETGGDEDFSRSERVAYLSQLDTFVWVEHQRSPRTLLLSQRGPVAESSTVTGAIVIPSPDERFIAIAGNGANLLVYDLVEKTWANLGKADIHPHTDWDYIKPSWNPWFADSSRLVFFSGRSLVVASPDGRHRTVVYESGLPAGLPVPSPDGEQIAFVTFTPRPVKVRPDLKFWGGTTIWMVPVNGTKKPRAITSTSDDTTYDLNWAGNDRLVFDRISDTPFYSHARVWSVTVPHASQ